MEKIKNPNGERIKNPAAVALGKLRQKSRPVTSEEARKIANARWKKPPLP